MSSKQRMSLSKMTPKPSFTHFTLDVDSRLYTSFTFSGFTVSSVFPAF